MVSPGVSILVGSFSTTDNRVVFSLLLEHTPIHIHRQELILKGTGKDEHE